ncbi:MAG: response regulator [SAR324 cluster bacterium]|nr:response regulator [SAR324 cluster bacterium]
MNSKVIELHQYGGQPSTLEMALKILSTWDSQKSVEQLNLDRARLRKLLPSLFQELSREEAELKIKVISLLGRAAISEAAPFLIGYLNDADHEIKESTIRALGLFGDHFAILPLKNAYENESAELKPLILQSLNQLVDDQFFFQLLGKDANLNKVTIALEILNLLATESKQLLTPGGFRRFLDQLVPHFQKIRRSDFDVKTLKQTIDALQNELYNSQEKNGYSLETLKFQLKIQHSQLQNFLESSGKNIILENEAPSPPKTDLPPQEEGSSESAVEWVDESAAAEESDEFRQEMNPLMETLTSSIEKLSLRLEEITQRLENSPNQSYNEEIIDPFAESAEETDETEDQKVLDPDLLDLELVHFKHEWMTDFFGDQKSTKAAKSELFEEPVFVLESNSLMRKNLDGLMHAAGFAEVRNFSNPLLALEAYPQEKEQLALITTECQMPEMDGRTFMQRIRAIEQQKDLPPCPILFISSETSRHKVRMLLEDGAAAVISKTFVPEELIGLVKKITGKEKKQSETTKNQHSSADARQFLDLKKLVVRANREAFSDNKPKNIKKKLRFQKQLKVPAEMEEDLGHNLRMLISLADFLSLPAHQVSITMNTPGTDQSAARVTLRGTTHYLFNHEANPEAVESSLTALKKGGLDEFLASHPLSGELKDYVAKVDGNLECSLERETTHDKFCLTLNFSWPLEKDSSFFELAALEQLIPSLENGLVDENPKETEADEETEVFQYLQALEEDENIEEIVASLERLCLREPEQIFILVDYLHDVHFENAAHEILEMFQKLKRIDVIPYLIRRFPHLHKEFKLWTLSFIAENDIRSGFFFIVSVLRDQDEDVRHQAMAVLVEHFDMRFLPLMIHSLKHTFNMPHMTSERMFLKRLPVRERSAFLSILLFADDFEKSIPLLLGYLKYADPFESEQIFHSLGHQESLKYLEAGQIQVLTEAMQEKQILELYPRLTLQLLNSSSLEFLCWIMGKISHERWRDVFKARFIKDIKESWDAVNTFLAEGMEEITRYLKSAGTISKKEGIRSEETKELSRMLQQSKEIAFSLNLEILAALCLHLELLLGEILLLSSADQWSENKHFINKMSSLLEVNQSANAILAQAFKNDFFLKETHFLNHLFPRLEKLTRKLVSILRKEVDIHFLEENTLRVDSRLFQILSDCLVQLIKNSIVHGIELPEQRVKQNKAPKAVLKVRFSLNHKIFRILVEDDGAGLDSEKILSNAIEKKILTAEEAEKLKNTPQRKNEIFDLIFSSPLFAAKGASMPSGRETGLNLVKSGIEKLGGVLQCESERGKGASFFLTFPLPITEHLVIEDK